MSKPTGLTKVLAIVGTALVALPLAAPLVLALFRLAQGGRFLFDYLLPAEVFPVVWLGGGLLLWAAGRVRARRALIGGGLGAAIGLLAAGQALAVVTGLASGATEPAGWPWALVLASLAGYWLALIALVLGGGLLTRDVLR